MRNAHVSKAESSKKRKREETNLELEQENSPKKRKSKNDYTPEILDNYSNLYVIKPDSGHAISPNVLTNITANVVPNQLNSANTSNEEKTQKSNKSIIDFVRDIEDTTPI